MERAKGLEPSTFSLGGGAFSSGIEDKGGHSVPGHPDLLVPCPPMPLSGGHEGTDYLARRDDGTVDVVATPAAQRASPSLLVHGCLIGTA